VHSGNEDSGNAASEQAIGVHVVSLLPPTTMTIAHPRGPVCYKVYAVLPLRVNRGQVVVHDTIVAMDILTGHGRIVTCTRENEHRGLFHGFPNSYGTLGYALKLTARTIPVERFVAWSMRVTPIRMPSLTRLRHAAPIRRRISSTASCSGRTSTC